jgi:hypothetical protein
MALSLDQIKNVIEVSEQPSLSDIDFDPQQKLMNNFFSS